MMLEAMVHAESSFATLTYADKYLPEGGTLVPRDLQLFVKRLRNRLPSGQLRFFGVGEYGDHTWRPHYHLALFGMGASETSRRLVQEAWGLGFTSVGFLTVASASYVAGYVTKKMTGKDDDRLQGRYPEFARMSLRPGIGAHAIKDVAAALQSKAGWDFIAAQSDVPSVLQSCGKFLPLGRYLRQRLRAAMNFEQIGGSDEAVYRQTAEMLNVYKDYLVSEKLAGRVPLGFKTALLEAGSEEARLAITRHKIARSRKGLGL